MDQRTRILSLCLCTMALTACQSEGAPESDFTKNASANEQTVQASPGVEERVQRALTPVKPTETQPVGASSTVDAAREVPRLRGQLASKGYGMTTIIDGSSPEAFASSLEFIAADTSPSQYRSLDSSIRFLKTYSMGTRNLAEFYRTVDGMTAEEVIEMAADRMQR